MIYQSNVVELKPENKLALTLKSLKSKISIKKSMPKYEFVPDKLALRKMILRSLTEQ